MHAVKRIAGMRIAELSRISRLPVATIKYYLREGLLPQGELTAANQADYSALHLHRLRLIRVLTQTGGLSLTATREVLAAIDDATLSTHDMLSTVQRALAPSRAHTADAGEARAEIDRYLAALHWDAPADAPGRQVLADALVALRGLGRDVDATIFDPYARLADDIARRELETMPDETDRAATVEAMVIGTVIFEAALTALRRLAHARHSAHRFAPLKPRRSKTGSNLGPGSTTRRRV
jgi:DNA-binding transcriptional MerR regulator